jgi:hypothetical protein
MVEDEARAPAKRTDVNQSPVIIVGQFEFG